MKLTRLLAPGFGKSTSYQRINYRTIATRFDCIGGQGGADSLPDQDGRSVLIQTFKRTLDEQTVIAFITR